MGSRHKTEAFTSDQSKKKAEKFESHFVQFHFIVESCAVLFFSAVLKLFLFYGEKNSSVLF